ncbi:MAG: hypothetical protein K5629_01385 [Eubacteriales bacterium]|nr:hypothetical protein [Eubacteriales bacterium]
MIIGQLILFCVVFTVMVKLSVGNDPLNGLYFYPKPFQERAFELGLADRVTVSRKRKRFMIPFVLMLLVLLVIIIGAWNGTQSFWPAYLRALLFLEVMNWYDGIVIDRIWVGHSRFWIIPGMEGVPYVQSIKQVLIKRALLTLIWIIGAAAVAELVVLFFGN